MGVTSPVAGNSMDRSTAWVMTKFDEPSKSQSVTRDMVWVVNLFWCANCMSSKQWVDPESTSARIFSKLYGKMETRGIRALGSERVDTLRRASTGALLESMQLPGCVESRGLLTLFLPWKKHLRWSPVSWTWQQLQHKLWPASPFCDTYWRSVQFLRRTCRGCCQGTVFAHRQ